MPCVRVLICCEDTKVISGMGRDASGADQTSAGTRTEAWTGVLSVKFKDRVRAGEKKYRERREECKSWQNVRNEKPKLIRIIKDIENNIQGIIIISIWMSFILEN